MKSRQIGELDKLSDLGASAKPGAHQANPLMDNYEGLVITNLDQLATPDASWHRGDGEYKAAISIISDDNYSATQTTRILDVEAEPFQKTGGRIRRLGKRSPVTVRHGTRQKRSP